MVIFSQSDARAFFLGIAELIPVFLIALFVIDNAWIYRSTEEVRRSVAMALDGATRIVKDQESEAERAVANQLKRIDKFAAAYDTPKAHSVVAEMRAETLGLADDFRKQGRGTLDSLSNSLDGIVRREEIAARKRATVYGRATIATIVPGMLGEIVSLWGAVGLADNRFVIAFAAIVSIGIAGTLSVLAMDRLIAEPLSGILAILRGAWITALCAATLTTFFWIMLSVRVRH